jgi:Ca2+-binding RTX toxin-like protein
MFRLIRSFVVICFALTAYLALAQPGTADTTSPYWTCRGSAGYLGSPSDKSTRIEPFVANGTDPKGICANDDAGHNNPPPLASDQGSVVVQSVYAGTRIDPAVSSSDLQKVAGLGQVQTLRIENSGKDFVLTADVLQAGVTGSCNGGVPGFASSGGVTNVVINGNQVPTDKAYEQTGNGLNGSPLGQVTKVFFNEISASGDAASVDQSVTRRAVHVQIFDGSGKAVFEAVVGEATGGRHGPVCQQGPRCPAGSVYDPARGVCVIREASASSGACPADTAKEGDVCVRTVVVGPPKDQGSGGTVVPLGDVKGVKKTSPCRNNRFGRQIAILGTSHGDRITGSNKSDRIFTFAGNDRVSGGRGNECIEGGDGSDQLDGSNGSDWLLGQAGNDQLSGGQRSDWLYGGDGNDKVIGGTGNDRLYGGKGRNKLDGGKGNDIIVGGPERDYIVGGNGRDIIRAGRGNDDINVATADARAKVDCGAGIDTVRLNNNELRSVKHCERILVTTRLGRLKSYNEAYQKSKKK